MQWTVIFLIRATDDKSGAAAKKMLDELRAIRMESHLGIIICMYIGIDYLIQIDPPFIYNYTGNKSSDTVVTAFYLLNSRPTFCRH